MASKLHYLTVQDILWINLQVTRNVNTFDYATLEEATFYQYGYGGSTDLLGQAARFATGFLAKRPFQAGNEPTAFVALAAFLFVNGRELTLSDGEAGGWFQKLQNNPSGARGFLEQAVGSSGERHGTIVPNVRDAVTHVLKHYPMTVHSLGGNSVAIVADGAIH